MMPTDKLAAVLWEADRHSDTLTEALAEWNASPTVTWQALESDRARVRIVDQLLFRFIKLQDTVGENSCLTRTALTYAEMPREMRNLGPSSFRRTPESSETIDSFFTGLSARSTR
ncbi:MAG: hypothetical protein HYX63_00985 [Gammaproteobacteria bacterium]|nr:hypothetical protein [Gammaproteobacteria bacterium]